MTEGEPVLITEEKRPTDINVSYAKAGRWFHSEAENHGFPELLPNDLREYSVALGYNSEAKIVRAFKIELYRRFSGGKGIMHREVLQIKANKAFGLPKDSKPPSAQ
jgi:hypothetical protein